MIGDLWRSPMSPFAELDWVRSLFDDLLNEPGVADVRSMPRGAFPLINVGATGDTVTVYVFAPGVDPASLDVSVEGNLLTLVGKRETAPEEGQPAYYRRERFSGEFRRTVVLPEGLDGDKAEARMHNGVLQLKLPKREELQPRRIEIQAA